MATNTNAILYVNPIDLGGNELLNTLLEKLSTAPSTPVAGRMYYNTTDNTTYFYNGTSWVDAGGSVGTSIEVIVESGYATLAEYVADIYNPAEFKHGDLLVLSDATDPGQRVWINLGIDNGNVNDFTAMSNAYDETEVKSFFSAGTGLTYSNGQFSVDTGGINTTQLADNSVTAAKINSNVAGAGLAQNIDGSLEVNVDGDTLEVSTDILRVKDGGITEAKLSTAVAEKLNKTGATFSLADTGVTGVTYSSGVFTVTHGFGTQAVAVVMRDSLNSYRQLPVNNDAPTANTVRIYFAEQPTNNQYKVTIIPMVF